MPEQPTLLIAGGGIAGLTAALAAHHAGLAARLFERVPALTEVGAGLQLGPNAMKVLRALGLDEAVRTAGHAPASLEMREGGTGQTLFCVPAGEAAEARWGAPYLNIRRADLQAILAAAVEARLPDALHLGREVVDYRIGDRGVRLVFDDERSVTGDILVAADGVRSNLRARMLGGERPDYTGHTAWRLMVEATPELSALVPDASVAWTGPGRHAVTYYLGGRRLINFVGVVEQPEPGPDDWEADGAVGQVRAAFAGFAGPVAAILDAADRARLWGLYDRPVAERLARGPVALIGDAAHPMPPFMAQGAGLAMESAWRAVASLAATGGFTRYERLTRMRASRLLDASRRNGDLFHGKGLPAAFGHVPVRLAARLAPPVILGRFDWVYRYDATRAAPIAPAT